MPRKQKIFYAVLAGHFALPEGTEVGCTLSEDPAPP